MVVDVKTGRTLHAENEDAPRHPASVTKVMTLYLLFEQLERGRLSLDTPLKVSSYAARQAPSKLGLRPGETITVEDAIKAIVTSRPTTSPSSIAENIGGSEEDFADMMTRKARALGMGRTAFRNAPACPIPEHSRRRAISPSSPAPSRTASRDTTAISRRACSTMRAGAIATTTGCSAASRASTASRPAIPAPPAST